MDAEDRERRFKEIEHAYEEFRKSLPEEKQNLVWDTAKGIYGPIRCRRAFDFFKQIQLQDYSSFIDIGSGDGRVVLIASLFTDASGIEIDEELADAGRNIASRLGIRCRLLCSDFLEHDLSCYDFLFSNPDQGWHKGLDEKLIREMRGRLFVNNTLFPPDKLKKGKNYWFEDMPIAEYTLPKR